MRVGLHNPLAGSIRRYIVDYFIFSLLYHITLYLPRSYSVELGEMKKESFLAFVIPLV